MNLRNCKKKGRSKCNGRKMSLGHISFEGSVLKSYRQLETQVSGLGKKSGAGVDLEIIHRKNPIL